MSRHRVIVWIAFADFFLALGLIGFASSARSAAHAAAAGEAVERLRAENERAKDYLEIDSRTRELISLLGDALQRRGVHYQIDSKQAAISLPEIALFESGSAVLTDNETVVNVAAALNETRGNWQQGFVLIVQGHTDARPVAAGSRIKNNLDLSRLRARALEEALSEYGISAPKFQVVSQGRGEFQPRVDNCVTESGDPPLLRAACSVGHPYRTEEELKANRRIELRFGLFTGNSLVGKEQDSR